MDLHHKLPELWKEIEILESEGMLKDLKKSLLRYLILDPASSSAKEKLDRLGHVSLLDLSSVPHSRAYLSEKNQEEIPIPKPENREDYRPYFEILGTHDATNLMLEFIHQLKLNGEYDPEVLGSLFYQDLLFFEVCEFFRNGDKKIARLRIEEWLIQSDPNTNLIVWKYLLNEMV